MFNSLDLNIKIFSLLNFYLSDVINVGSCKLLKGVTRNNSSAPPYNYTQWLPRLHYANIK